MIDLGAIKARCEAASNGKWQLGTAGRANIVRYDGCDICPVGFVNSLEDRRFIAAAREDVPQLVAEVERLRKALGVADEALRTYSMTDGSALASRRRADAIDAARAALGEAP